MKFPSECSVVFDHPVAKTTTSTLWCTNGFAEARIDCYNLRTMNEKLTALGRLVEIVERLRAPGGCPWDQQQTLTDMGRHMVEEVSETVDAIETGGGAPSPHVCEELGDVLMNIFLAATIASETGRGDAQNDAQNDAQSDAQSDARPSGQADGHVFGLADVARKISDKLVRRHPHVFGDTKVDGVDDVLANWNAIKARERQASGGDVRDAPGGTPFRSRLDAVPRSLPPLVRALELGKEAARAGFDWPDARGALEKVEEELEEVRANLGAEDDSQAAALKEELGDLLFAVVSLCRKSDIRPEDALRGTLRKFCQRFQAIERRFPDLEDQSLEAMEEIWQQQKKASTSEEGPEKSSS